MGTLEGKVAVVTGSGRGIGKETARIFAREGASVIINDVDETIAAEAVKELEAQGGTAAYCVADIRSTQKNCNRQCHYSTFHLQNSSRQDRPSNIQEWLSELRSDCRVFLRRSQQPPTWRIGNEDRLIGNEPSDLP